MLIKNAKIFTGKNFIDGDISFGKKIEAVGRLSGEADIDARGKYVVPGFVDIHSHGAMNEDFSDGRPEGIRKMAGFYAANGVTSFLATTMTLSEDELTAAMHAIRDYKRTNGSKCAGVHLEGPFLGYAKRGAQSAECLRRPDREMFDRLNDACDGQVKLITAACEEEGGMDFIGYASQKCTVSLGHTSCTYDQAMEAFARGASHATHLFNGMDGLHHRKPGIVAAAMDAGASVELICDGIHIHPSVIRLAHKLYGDRINLISDSMRCTGMPDGEYSLGGQPVTVKNGLPCISGTDTIAGSSLTMHKALKNVVRFGIPLTDALYAATTAPALAAGLKDVGSLQVGKCADILILDKHLNIENVFIDGSAV